MQFITLLNNKNMRILIAVERIQIRPRHGVRERRPVRVWWHYRLRRGHGSVRQTQSEYKAVGEHGANDGRDRNFGDVFFSLKLFFELNISMQLRSYSDS